MSHSLRRGRAAMLASLVVLALAEPAVAAPPSPGAAGAGDPLFPGLGNGGYDIGHYTLDLVYGSTAPVQAGSARVSIDARATQALSRFNLDFAGDSVSAVTVDGAAASFAREGEELVVTPSRAIRDHTPFTVVIAYTSGPRAIAPEDTGDLNKVFAIAWFATPSGSIT